MIAGTSENEYLSPARLRTSHTLRRTRIQDRNFDKPNLSQLELDVNLKLT